MTYSILDELLHHVHERKYLQHDPMITSTLSELSEPYYIDEQKEHTFFIKIGARFRCRDEELPYIKDTAAKDIGWCIYKYLYDDIMKLTKFVFRSGDKEMIETIKSLREKVIF